MSTSQESAPMRRVVTLPVGVVVERRKARSRWAEYIWKPVSVFVGKAPGEAGREMRSGEDWTQFYAGTAMLELHRAEAEDYKRNLSSPKPAVYIVLAPTSGPFPWRIHKVTASPYEGEAYMVGDANIVEAVTMPAEVVAFLEEFAETHFKPVKFTKRVRDTAPSLEAEKFGKEPIFVRDRKNSAGEASND